MSTRRITLASFRRSAKKPCRQQQGYQKWIAKMGKSMTRVKKTQDGHRSWQPRPGPCRCLNLPQSMLLQAMPNAKSRATPAPPANMWIFEEADPAIHVEAWLGHGCWVMKKGKNMCLLLATVCPRDREASLCAECQQPCRHHHQECKYKGQIPCAYCNKPPCKHGGQCSRKNFGCNFCHFDANGHCIPNEIDVQKYKLNSWGRPWPSWP